MDITDGIGAFAHEGFIVNNQTKGLYQKFNMSRVDGRDKPDGDRHDAEYFVLDMMNDPHARAALLAYAVSCRHDYPALSRDLLAKCEGMPEAGRVRDVGIMYAIESFGYACRQPNITISEQEIRLHEIRALLSRYGAAQPTPPADGQAQQENDNG